MTISKPEEGGMRQFIMIIYLPCILVLLLNKYAEKQKKIISVISGEKYQSIIHG